MIAIRLADERGHAHHGWLNSHHTFSFANYYDPAHMGWSVLRVINDDTVDPGQGFGRHSHRDMEIISYVLDGELAHRDSMGSGSVIRPGDVQIMSAGTGVQHSEFNASDSAKVNFLQIWITPKFTGTQPNYQEKHFEAAQKRGKLRVVVSPDGRDGSLTIVQDACLYVALLDGAEEIRYQIPPGKDQSARKAYVHVVRGTLELNGQTLSAGDGARIQDEKELHFSQGRQAEFLLFDLP